MASDLSAYHRVDNMWTMGSRRWAQLVPRLYAYAGAVQARMKAVSAESEPVGQTSTRTEPTAGRGGAGVLRAPDGTVLLAGPPSPLEGGKQVEATQTALRLSDIGDMFSFATVATPPSV